MDHGGLILILNSNKKDVGVALFRFRLARYCREDKCLDHTSSALANEHLSVYFQMHLMQSLTNIFDEKCKLQKKVTLQEWIQLMVHRAEFRFLLANLLHCTRAENKSHASGSQVQNRKGEPGFTSGAEVCSISTKA